MSIIYNYIYNLQSQNMVYAARHRVRIFIPYALSLMVPVDPIYNCSVPPYDDGYLLYLQCKFL
jgi:hypothetical protein